MGKKVIKELERTIKTICKGMREEKEFKPEKLTAVAKLVRALSLQEAQINDPMETGDPYHHQRLESSVPSDITEFDEE